MWDCWCNQTPAGEKMSLNCDKYTVNHKKTWQFIFDYNFGSA